MDDHCEECRLYGDDYSYDKDGDLVSNCYDCPMNPDSGYCHLWEECKDGERHEGVES